jgi:hypothetical protein
MLRVFAKIIAVILHPMLMPLYATWLLFNTGSYLGFAISPVLQKFIYIVVFISTSLLPSLSVAMMWKQGWVASLEMPERKERHLPFLVTLACFASGIFLLLKLPIPRIFGFIVGGGLLAILLAFLINLRWKISIHMMGIGGLMGLMYGYAKLFHVNMMPTLIVIAILCGLLGTARLLRNAHTPSQVYVGFLFGFFLEFGYIWIFVRGLLFDAV